jgi:hypothetical protein
MLACRSVALFWLPLLASCSGLLPRSTPSSPLPAASDPTPLAKCKVAANAQSPLVTEWPASEKAHLESLATSQTVAVEYTGCELRIVDGCSLPGRYAWRRTTLATDQVEITSADELYAKLPIGAVGLEGELARSGRLAVRTTVSGQLVNEWKGTSPPKTPACAGATHYISAISVGTFQLLSGNDASGSGKVGVAGLGGGARASRRESVLREAGSREACDKATDEAINRQCGSPIQVFLAPIEPQATAATPARSNEEQMRTTGVEINFPPPKDDGEVWTVRTAHGQLICEVPCKAWVGPLSGYYLQREPRNGAPPAVLHLPQSFPHRVGSGVTADYQVERGSPTLAKWTFYAAIPEGAMGLGFGIWGVVQATRTCEEGGTPPSSGRCFPSAGILFGISGFFLAGAAVATWWHLYSREEKFVTYENLPKSGSSEPAVRIMLGPGGVAGTL